VSHGVVHFEIPADDPDKLSDFYGKLFGWNIQKTPMGDGSNYWVVSTVATNEQGMPSEPGAINGGIYPRPAPEARPINYVNVESVDEYQQKAESLGARVVLQKMPIPGMGYFAQVIDPEGNQFGLFQIDPSAAGS
jgi:predicted enzyme related to lactoylglutathione lyase